MSVSAGSAWGVTLNNQNFVWDPNALVWVKETQPSGGGGGGAVTIADGADVALGATTDTAVTGDNPGTVSAKLRGISKILASVWDSVNGRLKVDPSAVTSPVSLASIPNPPNLDVALSTRLADATFTGRINTQGQKAMAASTPVVLASDQSAVPVSGTVTTTPPANASTNLTQVGGAAISEGQKAMAASVPVVIASDQTAVKVDGSAVTQPVSGTVTANQGTANATPWNDNVAQWGGAATSLGQKVSASSVPVVIASDQSAVPVSGTITANVANGAQETGGNLASLLVNLVTMLADQQQTLDQLLSDIRMELRIHNDLITQAFNISEDLELYRRDPYYSSSGFTGVN